nr:MAG TPA: hypothetical protein [Crassvirales sp.]
MLNCKLQVRILSGSHNNNVQLQIKNYHALLLSKTADSNLLSSDSLAEEKPGSYGKTPGYCQLLQ